MAFRITIVGLGTLGNAIGLALRRTGVDLQVTGHDKDPDAARRAHKGGCVDRTEWNLIAACDGADMVILSMPLAGIRSTLGAIAQDIPEGCIVTDTASVKVPVLDWARELLPASVHFVGGHPILPVVAGNGDADPGQAGQTGADLLAGAIYCLTPGAATSPDALQRVSDLVEAVGAKPYYIEAAEHDGLIAAVEQIPLLAALALQSMVSASAARREMAQLSGARFDRVTQLLAAMSGNKGTEEAEKLAAPCIHNSSNLARWLDVFLDTLAGIRGMVSSQDGDSLQSAFSSGIQARVEWERRGVREGSSPDYSAFGITKMMLGDSFRPRTKTKDK